MVSNQESFVILINKINLFTKDKIRNDEEVNMKLVIYGAKGIALGAYHSIKKIFPMRDIQCFLVTEIGINANEVCGIPVRELEEFSLNCSDEDKNDVQILIATPENVMSEIEQSLEQRGFYNHVRLNSGRWADMQRNAFVQDERFKPLSSYLVGFSKVNLHVYKAKFYRDRCLKSKVDEPDYIVPVQVGAALTDIRVADVLDNTGDHISEKNGNYSELTGLYWIWKNRLQPGYYGEDCYYGLAHYRRLLDLSDDDLLRIRDNDIDVVLPYPMPYDPNIEEHHKRYLSNEEWKAVLQALEELQPEYAGAFDKILNQEYFYNYNIIIARNKVLEEYCEWLFPILFRIEELNDLNGQKKPNRYMGYVGETLETLYFMYNKDRFRIAHTGCKFIV